MSQFWSKVVHTLTPYVPGEQPKIAQLIKLNTNENPYPPSPLVLDAIRQASNDLLRLYPDPQSNALRETIASYYGLSMDEVFVGNGSDEVLAHAFCALLQHDAPILFPDISYSFYPAYCALYGIKYRAVPLDQNFCIDIADYAQTNGGVIFPNPNAPTGIPLPLVRIETLLKHNPSSVVIIDEAYVDFGTESAVKLIRSHPNLLVIQTLSKGRALAGLRLGYALGQSALITALVRVKDSFNSYPIDRLATSGAMAAFADQTYFEYTCAQVIAARHTLSTAMAQLGFVVLPSGANFVFATHPKHDATVLGEQLRERRILVRHFRHPPRISAYLRISIGTEADMQILITTLGEILESSLA